MIDKNSCAIVLIDIQEKLTPHIYDNNEIVQNIVTLIKGAKILGIPVVLNEQYKKGLGETIPEIKEVLEEYAPIDKSSFSCCADERSMQKIDSLQREHLIVAGVEAHICVLQSVLGLKNRGYKTYVAIDCIGSRKVLDKEVAVQRMIQEGIRVATLESILFEVVQNAKDEHFKDISRLIK